MLGLLIPILAVKFVSAACAEQPATIAQLQTAITQAQSAAMKMSAAYAERITEQPRTAIT